MTISKQESARSLEPIVLKLLRKLLRPVLVDGLVFTDCSASSVRGIVVTRDPAAKREVTRDFEVGGFKGCSVGYVSVGGKRLFTKSGKAAPSRNARR